MVLIQDTSIKLKNRIYGRKDEQMAVLTLDPSEAQPPPLPFIPNMANYVTHNKLMSPAMRKNYIKDRAQAAVTYITEYGNTTLWSLENLVPVHIVVNAMDQPMSNFLFNIITLINTLLHFSMIIFLRISLKPGGMFYNIVLQMVQISMTKPVTAVRLMDPLPPTPNEKPLLILDSPSLKKISTLLNLQWIH